MDNFNQGRGMEYFQLDGEALTHIAMMTQDHYSVKLGIYSDLGCTIVQMQHDVSMFVFLPDEVTANMTLVKERLTAEFVQDLSMTLQPVKVALKLPFKSSATPLACCLCSLTRVSTHSSHLIRS
ncbi:pigment epithelium-derived factor-like [Salmo salar]|uniref:Pigment epithelium-derived factor-like n=1 Tax=Salmo salar TaxID=8030 RepID=A0ABM3CTN9_SALSA|nr:pigment epithelium-derived factor-like [Salmo salar]